MGGLEFGPFYMDKNETMQTEVKDVMAELSKKCVPSGRRVALVVDGGL